LDDISLIWLYGTGKQLPFSGTGMFVDFLADYWRNTIATNGFAHELLVGEQSDIAYSTIAAARTNPSRPYVDVTSDILQLGELPSLLRKVGNTIIQRISEANIRLQFGIQPIVTDLFKVCNYYEQVERRAKEIERLRTGRGLRRTIPLGKLDHQEIESSDGGGTVQSVYWVVNSGPKTGFTRMDVGAHVRWKPTVDLSHLDTKGILAQAKKAVLGLTFDGATAWELIPWSWLADYGTTVGDFFAAHRNIIPAEPSEISVTKCKHTLSRWEGWETVANGGPLTITPFAFERVTKYRHRVDVVAPVAQLPFLSANQVGILGSLAALRAL
jgi:hypothetical protein